MKRINSPLKFILLILIISVFILINPSVSLASILDPATPTPIPCNKGFGSNYCTGPDIHHVNCHGPDTVTTCYLSQDQRCEEGQSSCQTVQQTVTKITLSDIKLGDPVTVNIKGTGTCSQNNNFDPGPGLHNPVLYQQPNCNQTSFVCRDPNIKDQDYRCSWQYSCIAFEISPTNDNPVDLPPSFQSVFTSSPNASCTSYGDYTVGIPPACVQDTSKPVVDPNGDSSNDLSAKTLTDDKNVAEYYNYSMLPSEIINQSTSDCTTTPQSQIGVQLGFSALSDINTILCQSALAKYLQGINLLYCPINNNIASGQSNCFTAYTNNINMTSNPSNLKTDPAQRSCLLQDIKSDKGFTTGDKQLTLDSINVGSTNGYYRANLPNNIQDYIADPINYNSSIKNINVPGDLRASDINCAAEENIKTSFPEGIIPPHYDQNAMGCLTNGTEQVAPPGSVTACDAKWNLYHNPLGNFGDPQCNFTLEGLSDTLKQIEPNPAYFYEYYNVIVACESGYDPDAYGDHALIGTPDPNGAWGLFQMGTGTKRPPYGTYDRGNIPWQQQTTNAVNYNRLNPFNNSFDYWATKHGCPGHPSQLFPR